MSSKSEVCEICGIIKLRLSEGFELDLALAKEVQIYSGRMFVSKVSVEEQSKERNGGRQ